MKYLLALVALASLVVAAPADSEQAPFGVDYKHPGFDWDLGSQRLVQLQDQPPVWMSELEKIQAKARGIKFFDITDTRELGTLSRQQVNAFEFPSPNATEKVKRILKNLSSDGPRKNLEHFSSFRTRHYRSDTGKQSQAWLKKRIAEITSEWGSASLQDRISISEFTHSWGQNSIITRINGSSTTDDGVIIIGAHQDSTNMWPFLPAPGADDDGSGSVTILESYRALLAADFHPERSIGLSTTYPPISCIADNYSEFHWYSAEEGGLLGSQAVAQAYEGRVNVLAMSQFDMTAWVKRGTREEVGIITDFVDLPLTEFNKKLVDTYLDIPWVETQCGYACSDQWVQRALPIRPRLFSFHSASWRKAGYPSSFTIESTFPNSNKNIHSGNDRIDISDEFSFSHMLEFSKLAIAFAVELGGFIQKSHYSSSSSLKRPFDRSSYGSPSKRRKLDHPKTRLATSSNPSAWKPLARKLAVCELPEGCRKGAPNSHRKREEFIAHETERLQKSALGVKILSCYVRDDFLRLEYTQEDILNCSLAPSSPAKGVQHKEPAGPLLPIPLRLESPILLSTVHVPLRSFESGTLSFSVAFPINSVAEDESVASQSTSSVDADHSISVAELMFGTHGLATSSSNAEAAVATVCPMARSTASKSSSPAVDPLNSQSRTNVVTATQSLLARTILQTTMHTVENPQLASRSSSPVEVRSLSHSPHADPFPPTLQDPLPAIYRRTCALDGEEIQIPFRILQDKLRRFLLGTGSSPSFVTTMYGALDGVDLTSRKHWPIAQEFTSTKGAVDDACIVSHGNHSAVILGHNRDNQQLSMINGSHPQLATSAVHLQRPSVAGKKSGTSAVASLMQPLMFASGGYDHAVHIWTINQDFSSATPELTAIKHNSQVQSLLALMDTSHKLVSAGADCNVHFWDLSSERVVNTLKTSNSAFHLHSTTSPFCTLLEVSNREQQFEVRDHRLVPTLPVQRFGYLTVQTHGRFMKGRSSSFFSNCFASGDRGGNVRIWDLRKVERPCAEIECFNGLKISHLVSQSSNLVACAENNQIRWIKHDEC
ncbi:WD-repeats-region domain-containing protein [Favolaschia claudopus]|uniref:Peptide hydrolase n=1 Tax=Favolaschia claudopus TaxID=2862362 RepID=A0AAW0EB87_9AGAR